MPTRKQRMKQEIADCKIAIKTSVVGTLNHRFFSERLELLKIKQGEKI